MLFSKADWPAIDLLREKIAACTAPTVQGRAQQLTEIFFDAFPSVVLARVFLVQPLSSLPELEQGVASALVKNDPRLKASTPVLCLAGTRGREAAWNERTNSAGHLAIPLLDRTFVSGAPMIAKLLSDLEVDFAALDDGRPIATRKLLGGRNSAFFVPDAQHAFDTAGRSVIPARDFVARHQIRTVFGMGGAYEEGTLAIAIFFTDEMIERLVVDRFPSLIGNFKMATAALLRAKQVFAAGES